MAAEILRILVAIEPYMYREVVGFYFSKQRPQAEIVLATSEKLWDEIERTKPHLVVANSVPSELKEKLNWVEVRNDEQIVATINADGYYGTIHDVSMEGLLVAVEKAEEDLAHES